MRLRLTLLLLLALAASVLPPLDARPADAQAPARQAGPATVAEERTPVFPGLERRQLSLILDDGNRAVANVLAFAGNDPALELRPVLGRAGVHGLESVPAMGARLLEEGGVAGINGGFWLNNPVGDPNGFYAEDRRLVSEAQTQGSGPRGTVASLPDGRLLMDRLGSTQEIAVGGAAAVRLNGVNRYPSQTPPYPDGHDASFLYTPDFGPTVAVRAMRTDETVLPVRAFTVEGLQAPVAGAAQGVVQAVQPGEADVAVPPNGAVIVAHGDHATRFASAVAGDPATVQISLQPASTDANAWNQLRHGLAAGPLILQNGQRTDPSTWEGEGFSPGAHSNVRHPRSAIGRTADDQVLLVTVDGRQPGYSAGMTMQELADLLRQLGAVDAVALDGGGSTQLAVDGRLRNRPCCDASLRPVATGLFIHHSYEYAATERLAGTSRAGTAAAIAQESHPDGAQEVVLATQHTFADALSGGPLAALLDAPLLLAGRDDLPTETARALERLRPQRIILLGGPNAISAELSERLAARYDVRRVSGRDRYATAAAIATQLGSGHPRAFLVVGDNFPDALSVSAPAGIAGMPILLAGSRSLPEATRAALRRAGTAEVVIAGGPGAVSESVAQELRSAGYAVTRLAGDSRYATARQVNAWAHAQIAGLDERGVVVALGARFPDALAGGPLAADRRQLLMIVPAVDVNRSEPAGGYLRERQSAGLAAVTLLGGHGALTSYQQWQLDQFAR